MEPTPPPSDPRNRALLGLVLVAALVGGALYLVHVLGAASKLQDCVMSGRTNCAQLDPNAGR
jgi:hypothetical protein